MRNISIQKYLQKPDGEWVTKSDISVCLFMISLEWGFNLQLAEDWQESRDLSVAGGSWQSDSGRSRDLLVAGKSALPSFSNH